MIEGEEWEPALEDDAADRALDKMAIIDRAPPLLHLLSDEQILEEWERFRKGEWASAPEYWLEALQEARSEVLARKP